MPLLWKWKSYSIYICPKKGKETKGKEQKLADQRYKQNKAFTFNYGPGRSIIPQKAREATVFTAEIQCEMLWVRFRALILNLGAPL